MINKVNHVLATTATYETERENKPTRQQGAVGRLPAETKATDFTVHFMSFREGETLKFINKFSDKENALLGILTSYTSF